MVFRYCFSAVENGYMRADLKADFPNIGLSLRNLWNMQRFYERYKDKSTKLRQSVAVLAWGIIY